MSGSAGRRPGFVALERAQLSRCQHFGMSNSARVARKQTISKRGRALSTPLALDAQPSQPVSHKSAAWTARTIACPPEDPVRAQPSRSGTSSSIHLLRATTLDFAPTLDSALHDRLTRLAACHELAVHRPRPPLRRSSSPIATTKVSPPPAERIARRRPALAARTADSRRTRRILKTSSHGLGGASSIGVPILCARLTAWRC